MKLRSFSKNVLFLLLLVGLPLLVAFINFPSLLKPTTYLYGYPSDKLVAVWESWWRREAVTRGLAPTFTPDVRVPWGLNLTGDIEQWAYSRLRDVFVVWGGEVFLYNLLYLLVFEVSFLTLYFLVFSLTRKRSAGVVAGVIFSSSQYFLWHTMQNTEISLAAALLPLYFFCLWKVENLGEEGAVKILRQLSFALGTSFVFSLIFLLSFYIGYFAGLATLAFVLLARLSRRCFERQPLLTPTLLFSFFLFVFSSLLLTWPGTAPLIQSFLGGDAGKAGETLREVIRLNKEANLIAYGARPWDYLLPSSNHPLFGRGVSDFYRELRENQSYQFWSTFLPERPNYLTLTALLLAVYAVCRVLRRCHLVQGGTFTEKDRRSVLVFAFLALVMFLVSLPAVVTIKGINIYLPSFFLFKLFPMFRIYTRAGVFVLLGVAVLAGYGWKLVLERVTRGGAALVMSVGIVLLVLFENLNFPPWAVMDGGHVPEVYRWLRQRQGDVLLVEYPKDNSQVDVGGGCPAWLPANVVRDYNPAYEFFYQRIHRQKIFGYNQLPFQERAALGDLGSSPAYEILARYGVDYVVIHTQDPMLGIHPWPYPQENPLDECWSRRIMRKPEKVYEKFKLVAEFADGVIYQL